MSQGNGRAGWGRSIFRNSEKCFAPTADWIGKEQQKGKKQKAKVKSRKPKDERRTTNDE